MPSQPNKAEKLRRQKLGKIGGGYTTCNKPGRHEQVNIWDFKSEYPSAIQTWDIDPTTFVKVLYDRHELDTIDRTKFIVTPSDVDKGTYHPHRVYRKEEGVIPKVLKFLVAERDKIKYTMKDEKDPDKYLALFLDNYAIKTDGNSIYGILAFVNSRYYSWDLGDSVTTCCRATLKACNEMLEENGISVLGGDTDSTFVLLNGNTKEDIDAKFTSFLQKWADSWGSINNKLVFEHEKVFNPMFFVKMKNYAFIEVGKEDKGLVIKGMECIKSDSNPFASALQREFIEDVVYDKVDAEAWKKKVISIHDKVFNQELKADDLILIKGLSKMIKDYEGFVIDSKTGLPKIKNDGTLQKKAIPAHVKLADRLIKDGADLNPGSKISFIVVKDKPILAITPEEFKKGTGVFPYVKKKTKEEVPFYWEGVYDAKYYWYRIIKPLAKVIIGYYNDLPNWNWSLTPSEINKIYKGDSVE